MNETDLLPVGAYVRVTETDHPPYVAKVVGYDTGRSKYEVGVRYFGWNGVTLFRGGGTWVFPREVEQIGEQEALRREMSR